MVSHLLIVDGEKNKKILHLNVIIWHSLATVCKNYWSVNLAIRKNANTAKPPLRITSKYDFTADLTGTGNRSEKVTKLCLPIQVLCCSTHSVFHCKNSVTWLFLRLVIYMLWLCWLGIRKSIQPPYLSGSSLPRLSWKRCRKQDWGATCDSRHPVSQYFQLW